MSKIAMTFEQFKKEWAVDGMPKDKQRLAEAAWAAAIASMNVGQDENGGALADLEDAGMVATRLRRLSRLLGLSVPESDESLLLCAIPVLGLACLAVEDIFNASASGQAISMAQVFEDKAGHKSIKATPENWLKLQDKQLLYTAVPTGAALIAMAVAEREQFLKILDYYSEHGILPPEPIIT